MKAIIMAGGEGKRLKPVTGELPKPMAPLLGKPVMEHIITLLRENGFRDICASLAYRPEVIQDYFGDGSRLGVRLTYHIEDSPLGTAGGVRACADFYGNRDFLVISGDAACDFDLKALFEAHRRSRPGVTMALYPQEEPLSYGLVLIDRDGRVVDFIEKPPWEKVVTDLSNTGIYIISPRAMENVPENTKFDFAKDLFPLLMQKGEELRGVIAEGYWCDIGTPAAYYRCCLDALEGRLHIESGWPPEPVKPHVIERRTSPPLTRTVPCRNRARLMRVMSENLYEFGADFSDGINISDGNCSLHISPSPDSEAICIECLGDDSGFLDEMTSAIEFLSPKV